MFVWKEVRCAWLMAECTQPCDRAQRYSSPPLHVSWVEILQQQSGILLGVSCEDVLLFGAQYVYRAFRLLKCIFVSSRPAPSPTVVVVVLDSLTTSVAEVKMRLTSCDDQICLGSGLFMKRVRRSCYGITRFKKATHCMC